jgi:hypothetical protein
MNLFGASISTAKKNKQALLAAAKEIGLEVTADKTKYTVMSGSRMQDTVTA